MNFNPQEKFGRIYGTNPKHPTARYKQGNLLYDTHRKCLNPQDAVADAEPTTEDTIADATDEFRAKASKAASAALKKLEKAKSVLESAGTPAAKSAHTKALNIYERAQKKLDSLG